MSKPFVPTIIVGEAVAGEAFATKQNIEALINTVNKSTFDIAELLLKVKTKGYYVDWGFSTFKEYTTSLKIKARKAQYLTRIVGVMQQVGIPRAEYEPLGIARLREITSLDPDINYHNPNTGMDTPIVEFIKIFVQKVPETGDYMDIEDIQRHVRTLKGLVGENDLVWVHLQMTRLAWENDWTPAIQLATANYGSVGKDDEGISKDVSEGTAAVTLAVEYLNDPANKFANLLAEPDEEESSELETVEG